MSDHAANGGQVVPFGKYKGQPVEVLAADADYCEWLVGQDWFRTRFGNVYNVVINQLGGDTFDTPEHNQMQAQFLDDAFCVRLAELLDEPGANDPKVALRNFFARERTSRIPEALLELLTLASHPSAAAGRRFESEGWDVVFGATSAGVTAGLRDLPPCICECDHSGCGSDADCRLDGGVEWCAHRYHPRGRQEGAERPWVSSSHDHCCDECPWRDSDIHLWLVRLTEPRGLYRRAWARDHALHIYVDCKPDLGDDFPSVLRQASRYSVDDRAGVECRRVVLVRRYRFEQVTWEQVVQMFAASKVTLVREADLDLDRLDAGSEERER